jgi:hypothetical protein
MRTLSCWLLVLGLSAGLAIPAAAQRRGFLTFRPAISARASIAQAPRAMISARVITLQAAPRSRAAMAGTAGTMTATTVTSTGFTTEPIVTPAIGGVAPITVGQLLNPVPGFGFDFRHLAAVNENLDIRALIDPVTQERLALAERLLEESEEIPVVFPAFASSPTVLVQSPPVIVIQQPAPAAAPSAEAPAAAAAAAVPAAPPLPAGDLILVRKDGSEIRVAAFTQQGNQIVYITRKGDRRSITLAALDLDATVRANEANGTFVRFSL